MAHLLAISSSARLNDSVSRRMVEVFADGFVGAVPDGVVTRRDLDENPPPHLSEDVIAAIFTPPDQRTDSRTRELSLSDTLVDELLAADVIMIGAPMNNFSISSALKAWIDHVTRAGRTFNYTANGPEGLLNGKTVYVLTARGGNYADGSPMRALDHQEPYLRMILGFIGLDDVTFIHCQGLAMGDDIRDQAIAGAESEIGATVRALAA